MMLRFVALFGAVVAVLASSILYNLQATYSLPSDADIPEFLTDTWAWEHRGCDADPQVIRFAPDRSEMYVVRDTVFVGADGVADSITTYRVIAHKRDRITGAIPGERRMTRSGVPVVWDLVLRSPDRIAWHQTDWSRFEFTRELVRCDTRPASPE